MTAVTLITSYLAVLLSPIPFLCTTSVTGGLNPHCPNPNWHCHQEDVQVKSWLCKSLLFQHYGKKPPSMLWQRDRQVLSTTILGEGDPYPSPWPGPQPRAEEPFTLLPLIKGSQRSAAILSPSFFCISISVSSHPLSVLRKTESAVWPIQSLMIVKDRTRTPEMGQISLCPVLVSGHQLAFSPDVSKEVQLYENMCLQTLLSFVR